MWVPVSRLDSVSWRVDYVLSSSELKEVNEPEVHLKLQSQEAESGSTETTVVSVSADKFRVLLTGLFCNVSNVRSCHSLSLSFEKIVVYVFA